MTDTRWSIALVAVVFFTAAPLAAQDTAMPICPADEEMTTSPDPSPPSFDELLRDTPVGEVAPETPMASTCGICSPICGGMTVNSLCSSSTGAGTCVPLDGVCSQDLRTPCECRAF